MRTGVFLALIALPLCFVLAQSAPPLQNATPVPDTNVCAKAITIYLDTSGTMTQPMRNRGNRLPISDVAQTLLRFITAENFLTSSDTVTVKYFGSAVRTQAENRAASVALLTQLADPSTAAAAAAALHAGDLHNLTDFARLFDDLENRVKNAASRRQIIFVASDFAHDPLNNAGCPDDVAPRVQSFQAALARIRPRLTEQPAQGGEPLRRVEIAGLFAPEGSCRSDNEVARQVQEGLESVGVRFYRYDQDAAEAALTINNELIGTVTAQPTTPGVIHLGPDNRLPFVVANPNCVDARITALQFDGPRTQRVDITPFVVSGSTREVRLDVDKVATLWNQDVRVTPVIEPGTSLNTEPSQSFWMGDWIRVRGMSPYLYPRSFREGQTLVAATVERSLRATAGLSVAGVDAGSRPRLFQLPRGGGEQLYMLPFDLNEALVGRLSGAGTMATLGTTGIRLLTDDTTAAANLTAPLTVAVASQAANWIDWVGAVTLGGHVLLLVMIVFTTYAKHGDDADGQSAVWLPRVRKLVPGAVAAVSLLATRFGTPFLDERIWALATWRAFASAVATFFLIRSALVEMLWKPYVEPRLLPAERAIRARRGWNGLIYALAVTIAVAALYLFFWAPPAAPPPGASVLQEVAR
jgi:hypothetical protein